MLDDESHTLANLGNDHVFINKQDESPTSANLGNDHVFINKEYSNHVESRVRLTYGDIKATWRVGFDIS